MFKLAIFVAIYLFMLIQCSESVEKSVYLDADDKFKLTWSFTSTNPGDEIVFKIECETSGWVSIGTSPNGGMAGADIVIAWVDSNGKSHIKDMHATSNSLPTLDNSQDVELISASEANGKTIISFKRKMGTCDEDDRAILTSTTRLIHAYGVKDPENNILSASDYHSARRRGAKSVYLLESESKREAEPKDAFHIEMRLNNFTIPSSPSTYYCKFFEPPANLTKHHVVSIEPIITPGNEALIHHILVYACWGVSKEHIRNSNKTEGTCYSREMPEFSGSCTKTSYAWGIGGEKFYIPENAGIPIGIGTEEAAEYYLMETHIDNPEIIKGRKDSSGLRFTLTPTLRKYDADVLEIGSVSSIFVPPKQKAFKHVSYCYSDCTRKWIPEEGVTLFAYLLHSHLIGVAMKVEWYRNGKAVRVLARDDSYDFNYQEYRLYKEPKKLLPGDVLKITCVYNSERRQNVTYGGLPSKSEMCLAFFMYYPKQSMGRCNSLPSYMHNKSANLYKQLSVTPKTSRGTNGFLQALNDVEDWSSEKVSIAQKAVTTGSKYVICTIPNAPAPTLANIASSDFPDIKESEKNDPCKNTKSAGSSILAGITSLTFGTMATIMMVL